MVREIRICKKNTGIFRGEAREQKNNIEKKIRKCEQRRRMMERKKSENKLQYEKENKN